MCVWYLKVTLKFAKFISAKLNLRLPWWIKSPVSSFKWQYNLHFWKTMQSFFESINISRCVGQNAFSEKQSAILHYHIHLKTYIWELIFFAWVLKSNQGRTECRHNSLWDGTWRESFLGSYLLTLCIIKHELLNIHLNFDWMVASVESSQSHWGCWLNSPAPDFFLGGNFFQIVAGGTKYPDQVFCDSASICQCNTLKLTMATFSFICISLYMIMFWC